MFFVYACSMLNSPTAFRLAELYSQEADDRNKKKSERTALRLLQSVAEVLDDVSYPQLRAADIADNAGVAYGTMYRYFKDKAEPTCLAATRLTLEFQNRFHNPRSVNGTRLTSYQRTYLANAFYLDTFILNKGLFRVLFTQTFELPEVKVAYETLCLSAHSRIGSSLRPPEGLTLTPQDRLVAGYMLGGMADEILRQVFLLENADLAHTQDNDQLPQLCTLLSIMWYRAAHGKDPSMQEIESCQGLLGATSDAAANL